MPPSPRQWRRSSTGVAAGLVLIFIAGCATSRAPSGWLPNAEHVGEDAYGAWVEIRRDGIIHYGELVAVDDDSLYVLSVGLLGPERLGPEASTRLAVARRDTERADPESAGLLRVIPRSSIQQVRLFWFDSDWEQLALMSAAGTVGTLAHGVALVFTAPIWIIGGISTSRMRSRDPLIDYPTASWSSLRPYARFPQGFPLGTQHLAPRRR